MFDHNFIFVVDLTETFNFTHSETMHEIDHEEVFIIAKPICQQMDNRSKKQDAWLTNGSVGALYTYIEWFYVGILKCLMTVFHYISLGIILPICLAVLSSGSHKTVRFVIH